MQTLYESKQAELEAKLLGDLSAVEPWALIERFTTLVRESSSEDERIAFQYIADRLAELGISHQVYRPELFLSVPVEASLAVGDKSYRAKTPAFSISTPTGGIAARRFASKILRPAGASTFLILRRQAMWTSAAKLWLSMALAGRRQSGIFKTRALWGRFLSIQALISIGASAPLFGARLIWTIIIGSPRSRSS